MIAEASAPVVLPARFSSDVTLETAARATIDAKLRANLRPKYVKDLKRYLTQFVRGRESLPISKVDVYVLEDWFQAKAGQSPSTMQGAIGRLSAMFSFAERRGWILRNPCRMLEKPRVDRKAPRILSPDEAERLMSWCRVKRPQSLAFVVLAMYAGVRPVELERIGWESVHPDRAIAVIDSEASKTRRRRIVELHPKACRLLKEAKELGAVLPVRAMARRRLLTRATVALGLDEWPQDCLRHSAASYQLALYKNAQRVSLSLGNSVGILHRHYLELVHAEDCERFWA